MSWKRTIKEIVMSNLGFEFEVQEIRLHPVDIRSSYVWQGGKRNVQDMYFQEESVSVEGIGEGSVDSMEESDCQS